MPRHLWWNAEQQDSPEEKKNKLGMRASETAEMIFDHCRIPDANRLGKVGEGFKQSLKVLDGGQDFHCSAWRGNRQRRI